MSDDLDHWIFCNTHHVNAIAGDHAIPADAAISKIKELAAEVERLRGSTPELPPRPPFGSGLPRYGVRWNGDNKPITVPMDDGYWTPFHLANQRALDAEKRADELEQARNILTIKNNELKQDKARLDYLDDLNAEMNARKGSNYGWSVDWNNNRVALNDTGLPKVDVRTAIDKHKALMSMQLRNQAKGE